MVKGRRKTWFRKKEPFRWHFYSAINKELSPNPFLAKSQALRQRSVRLLSPSLGYLFTPYVLQYETPCRIIRVVKKESVHTLSILYSTHRY